jgi:hypothetical protein
MTNKDITDSVNEHEKHINEEATADFFKAHPDKVRAFKEKDRQILIAGLGELDTKFKLLVPYIKFTKRHLKKGITERTKFSACFLIYHKIIQSWEALLVLAKKGYYQESMEMLRSIGENIDLVNLFIFQKESKNLEGWFSGEIIQNSIARENFQEALNASQVLPTEVEVKKLMAHIYKGFSNYTHGGYVAMLESIDVFRKDFDFEKTAGYHRLSETLPNFRHLINALTLSLTSYYLLVVEDQEKSSELKDLWSPAQFTPEEIVEHMREKFGQKDK